MIKLNGWAARDWKVLSIRPPLRGATAFGRKTLTTPALKHAHPGWTFFLLWLVATFIGGLVYFVPVGIVQIILGLDRMDNPQRAGEITPAMLILAAVLCGAAGGSTIGLAQWLVLRRELKRIGGWIVATIAGYASIGTLPLIANAWQPGWLNWAITLIVNGKMHWLARVEPFEPAWTNASWSAGAITLTLFGFALGIVQWLVLRRCVKQAAWWIAISTIGWAMAAGLSSISGAVSVFASWGVPMVITGIGMVWLLRHSTLTV